MSQANINLSGTIYNELQSKVITERINHLEKYLGDMCQNFGKVSRKNARLRDTGDGMVSTILEYAGKERFSTSSIQGLKNYAQKLSEVEDYRNAMIERIEKVIIQPLSKYDEILKELKKTIKSTITVRDKEKQKQQKLNVLLQKQPDDGRNIAQAEATVENAAKKVAEQDNILRKEICDLEEKKLTDIKKILKDYTHIQILFHAKALERLTEAYQHVQDIDIDNDKEEFNNAFQQTNLSTMRPFQSKQSLNTTHDNTLSNTGGSLPVTPNRQRANDGQKYARRAKSNENLSRRSDYSPNSTATSTKHSISHRSNKNKELEVEDYSSDSEDD